MSIAGRRKPRRRVQFTVLAGIVLLAATWTVGAPAKPVTTQAVKPFQELAALRTSQEALSQPAKGSTRLGLLRAHRPITEIRTVLPVLRHRKDRNGLRWLQVRLPGRPNGRTGWIRKRGTVSSWTSWHVVVDTSSRQVTVYNRGRRARVFKGIVGKASTPTPHGRFFVEEAIQLSRGAVGGPFALALSARSNVLQEFAGGPGQIAVHGLWNVGGTLGTAVSHGCVRVDTAAMRWLVARVGPGAPVTITP